MAIIIGAAVLALMVIAGGIWFWRDSQVKAEAERAAVAQAQAEAERDRQEEAATTSVQGYLEALADSDADRALGYAAEAPPGNTQLLSRDVLLESNKRAPMAGIATSGAQLTANAQGGFDTGVVTADYQIGDQPRTTDYTVTKVGDDWKLTQVSAPVNIGTGGPQRIVNGVTVEPGVYQLFPGSYSVTSANPLVGLAGTEYVLVSPSDTNLDWQSELTLSEEGRNQSVEASKRAVNDCLNRRELAPAGCPFIRWREADGLQIDTNTLRYTLKNDPWENVNFEFAPDGLTAATKLTIAHEISGRASQGGRSGPLVPETQTLDTEVTVALGSGQPEVSFR